MKLKIFISFIIFSIFSRICESHTNNDPVPKFIEYGDEYVEKRTLKDLTNILNELGNLANLLNLDEISDLKRFSVVNDIAGKNVVSDIKGTKTNLHPTNMPAYMKPRKRNPKNDREGRELLELALHKLGISNEERDRLHQIIDGYDASGENAIAHHKHAEDSIRMMQSLIDSLANCQKISEKILNHEVVSKKDINNARRRMNQELSKAKELCNKMAPDTPNGVITPEMDLMNAIDRAIKISNKFSGMTIDTKEDLMEISDQLEDEIESAMEISQEIAKKMEENPNDEEKVEDEKEIEQEDDDKVMVKALKKAIDLAKNVDDNTLRKFAMKNKIRGENVVSKQNFHEVNYRRPGHGNIIIEKRHQIHDRRISPVESWNIPSSFDSPRRTDLTSADQHDVYSQPRYFWDESKKDNEKENLNDDEEKKDKLQNYDKNISNKKTKYPWQERPGSMVNDQNEVEKMQRAMKITDEDLMKVDPLDSNTPVDDKDMRKMQRNFWQPIEDLIKDGGKPKFPEIVNDEIDQENVKRKLSKPENSDIDPEFSKINQSKRKDMANSEDENEIDDEEEIVERKNKNWPPKKTPPIPEKY